MMTIQSVYHYGVTVTDIDEIRRLCLSNEEFTIIASDEIGQTNLLTSSDYKGEKFLLKNNEEIVIRQK